MKTLIFVVITTVIYAAVAFPQIKEGQAFSKEAINQAVNTQLIPKNAQISSVDESRQAAAIESIPGDQPIDLITILKDHGVPQDVIHSLQDQINNIGHN